MSTNQKAVFVIGPESSGSTYIAKLISRCYGDTQWTGRGFNCCDDAMCDRENGFVYPHKPVQNLVCHRSLPFHGDFYPPIERWLEEYDCKFVLCTRDRSISEASRLKRWGGKKTSYAHQTVAAAKIMRNLLERHPDRTFVFSFEAFILLDSSYLGHLYAFLDISSRRYPDDLFDANRAYVRSYGLVLSRVKRTIKSLRTSLSAQ